MTKKCDGAPCFGGSTRSNKIECRNCRKSFHAKCANLNGSQLKAIRDLPGVFWFCTVCRSIENRVDQQVHSSILDLVLHRINSFTRLVYAQIDATRSLCRSLGNEHTHVSVPRMSFLDKSSIVDVVKTNFENALDQMQFEFSRDFNDLVAENTHRNATDKPHTDDSSIVLNDNNKRDRTSSSDLSPNSEKRMRVDVPNSSCENSNTVALPLTASQQCSAEIVTVSTSQANVILPNETVLPSANPPMPSPGAVAIAASYELPAVVGTAAANESANTVNNNAAITASAPANAVNAATNYQATTVNTPANTYHASCTRAPTIATQATKTTQAINAYQATFTNQAIISNHAVNTNQAFIASQATPAAFVSTTQNDFARPPAVTSLVTYAPSHQARFYPLIHDSCSNAARMHSVGTQTSPNAVSRRSSLEYIRRDNTTTISTNSGNTTVASNHTVPATMFSPTMVNIADGPAQSHQSHPLPTRVNQLRNTAVISRQNGPVSPTLSIANREDPRKWFYVSPFQPHETAQNISDYVSMKANCRIDQVICQKLVSENRSNGPPLTFISFKLSVPEDIVPTIRSDKFWPEGIVIKPFLYQRPPVNRLSAPYPSTSVPRTPITRIAIQRPELFPSARQLPKRYQMSSPLISRTQTIHPFQTLV